MANYQPPSPFVFIVSSGYAPPAPLILVVVGDDGTRSASGRIVPVVETVSSTGNAAVVANGAICPSLSEIHGIVQLSSGLIEPKVEEVTGAATSFFAFANISPSVESLSDSAESDLGQSAGSVSARCDKIKATGVSSAVICTVRPVRDGVVATGLNNIVCWGRISPARESVSGGGVGHVFSAGRYVLPVDRVSVFGMATAISRGKISERQSVSATAATTALIVGKAAVMPKVCVVGASSIASVLCSWRIAHRLEVISSEAFVIPSCSARVTPKKDSVSIATTIFRQGGIFYTRDKVMFPTAAAPTLAPLSFGRDSKTSASFGAPAPEVIFEFERT